jgi:hypothetical protein
MFDSDVTAAFTHAHGEFDSSDATVCLETSPFSIFGLQEPTCICLLHPCAPIAFLLARRRSGRTALVGNSVIRGDDYGAISGLSHAGEGGVEAFTDDVHSWSFKRTKSSVMRS